MKTEFVSKEAFQKEVQLWGSKGNDSVVSVRFNSTTMVLTVPDYVYPDDLQYCISVIDANQVSTLKQLHCN